MKINTKALKFLQDKAKAIQQPILEDFRAGKFETLQRLERSLFLGNQQSGMMRDLMISLLANRWLQTPDVLASRNEVGYWLNWHGLVGEGVEIGVFRGQFSYHLLDTWECERLTSVDPWKEFASDDYVDVCNLAQDKHERNFQETLTRLSSFGERSRVLRSTSLEGAEDFGERTLDFVYLDAQHHYEAVREDIRAWYPKLRRGGVLGGHDYLDGVISSGVYGVKQAADEFAASIDTSIIVTREPVYKSWFVRIP